MAGSRRQEEPRVRNYPGDLQQRMDAGADQECWVSGVGHGEEAAGLSAGELVAVGASAGIGSGAVD